MSDRYLAQLIWNYLRFEQPLEKADVIIGLGSHDMQTAEHCANLYLQNYSKNIVFCGGRGRLTENLEGNEADRYAELAIARGVNEMDILKDVRSTNTGENIVNACKLLKKNNLNVATIILVTKPYMLRRAYATCMQQWPSEEKPKVICSAINIDMEDYMDSIDGFEHATNIMVGDLQRIREYPKLGFQIEQEIPESVWNAYVELVKRGYTTQLIEK